LVPLAGRCIRNIVAVAHALPALNCPDSEVGSKD